MLLYRRSIIKQHHFMLVVPRNETSNGTKLNLRPTEDWMSLNKQVSSSQCCGVYRKLLPSDIYATTLTNGIILRRDVLGYCEFPQCVFE